MKLKTKLALVTTVSILGLAAGAVIYAAPDTSTVTKEEPAIGTRVPYMKKQTPPVQPATETTVEDTQDASGSATTPVDTTAVPAAQTGATSDTDDDGTVLPVGATYIGNNTYDSSPSPTSTVTYGTGN